MSNTINQNLESLKELIETVQAETIDINPIVQEVLTCFKSNRKLMFCGNGGSAAEAQHIAAEYVSSLRHDVKRKSLPAIALTTDTSFITASSNDFGFEHVFERQVESLGNKGDMLFGLTTSGDSANVVKAIKLAKEKGILTVGITGKGGGKLKEISDYLVEIPSKDTQRIQELSMLIQHSIAEAVEDEILK